ncbi:MAG: YraN family protein [Eubacteriales bacterium]
MNKRTVGTEYERVARTYLEQHQVSILTINYRCQFGEIDLIAYDKGCLVFVEVKYRKNHNVGYAQEAVNWKKQKVISKVASYYCMTHQTSGNQEIRFDVVAITGDEITWIQDAFVYCE